MARFTVQMTCDNAAFADDMTGEIARILRTIADRLDLADADFYQTIRDINGNDVGRYRLAINRQD